jgi:hypothetical protein
VSLGTLAPYAFPQALDDNGFPLDGGFLWTYAAGLVGTLATTWQDADLTVPNTNPIVLSAGGRYKIYLAATSYKFILTDALGVVIDSTDPVGSVGLTQSGVYTIFNFGGDPTSPITTGYPLGPTFASCHAGTAIYPLDSANLAPGTYKLQGMALSTLGAAIVTVALVNLTDGAPDTPIIEMSGSNAAGNVITSGPITFAAGGSVKNYGIKAKVDTGSGFAWAIQLVKVPV